MLQPRKAATARIALVALFSIASTHAIAITCYKVHDKAGRITYRGPQPPIDLTGDLTAQLKKQWGGSYASGKVLPETYISYIKANQPENERMPDRYASDSPNHHYWFKSELLYSSILLAFLGATGIGWIVYKIKSARWKPE